MKSLKNHYSSYKFSFLNRKKTKTNKLTDSLGALGDHVAPRVDNHGVSVRLSLLVVLPCLCRRNHVALILDRSSTKKGLEIVSFKIFKFLFEKIHVLSFLFQN